MSARPAADASLTRHAATRLRQRGIPAWFVDLLVRHGHAHHDGHGALVLSIARATRSDLRDELTRPEFAAAERYFDVYAVISTDRTSVITAARRTRRHFH